MDVVFIERILTCVDCGQDFIFSEDEQRYFWSKGLAEPKRCKPCRVIRRRSIVSIMKEKEHNDHSNTQSGYHRTNTTF
jgi:ribosomal protein L36